MALLLHRSMEQKKRPRIGLSLFSNLAESFSNRSKNAPLRTFGNSGGAVGLGILLVASTVASRNDDNSNKKTRPLPIIASLVRNPDASFNQTAGDADGEEYTCVISHFEGDVNAGKENLKGGCQGVNKDGIFDASTSPLIVVVGRSNVGCCGFGSEDRRRKLLGEDFLSSCFLCRKLLHGLDIFMYRGEKAFCSVECREKQIVSEDHRENCSSEARRTHEYSASPCSSPQLFFAGVAAA